MLGYRSTHLHDRDTTLHSISPRMHWPFLPALNMQGNDSTTSLNSQWHVFESSRNKKNVWTYHTFIKWNTEIWLKNSKHINFGLEARYIISFLTHPEYFLLSYFSPLSAYMDLSQSCKVNPLRTSLWFCHHPVELFDVPSGLQWGRETSFSDIRSPFVCSCAFCSNTSAAWPLNPFFSSHPLYTPTSVPLVMFSDTCRALATLTYVVWHVTAGTGSRGIRSQGSQTAELGFKGSCLFTISELFSVFFFHPLCVNSNFNVI